MIAGVAEPPKLALNFTPFQFHGLWLEVTTTPPAAPWFFTASEIAGVGVESEVICTGMPAPADGLSRDPGRLRRKKTSVVADDDAASGIFMPQNVGRNPARHATNIVEGEIVGDNAAPAVGAKFDHMQSHCSRRSSVVSGHSRVVSKAADSVILLTTGD